MFMRRIVLLSVPLVSFGLWGWWASKADDSKPIVTDIKTRMPDVSPEVRAKAFGLLDRVLGEAESLKSSDDRIRMRFLLADLLWEKDEPRARELFTTLAADEGCLCNNLSVETIAARDAKFAVRISEAWYYSGLPLDQRDAIYEHFAKQYPDEALSEAKRDIEDNRILSYINEFSNRPNPSKLGKLYNANRSHGANLARDIVRKFEPGRISVPTPFPNYNLPPGRMANLALPANLAANFPAVNYRSKPVPNYDYNFNFNAVSRYANSVANIPRRAGAMVPATNALPINVGDTKIPFSVAVELLTLAVRSADEASKNGGPPILTASEIKGLARTMIAALTRAKGFETYWVRPAYAHLKKYAPVETARLEKRLTLRQKRALTGQGMDLPGGVEDRSLYDQIPAPPIETQLEKEEREFVNDVRYHSQTYRSRDYEADAEKFVRFKDPEKYPDLIEYFKDSLPTAYARTANLAKLRTYLANEPNRASRLTLLSLAAFALADRNDKQGAANLIDEANNYLPSMPKKREEFRAAETYALALARITPDRGFALSEKLVDQADRLLGLSAELRDFTTDEDDASSSFEIRRNQVAMNSSLAIKIIRVLAHSDFERTVKLADRFSDRDQQVFFRWHIANALLNKNAESEEGRHASNDLEMEYYRPQRPNFSANKLP